MPLKDIAEALQTLSVGRTKFYSELNSGKIRAVKIGRRTYVASEELDRYVRDLPTYESKSGTPARRTSRDGPSPKMSDTESTPPFFSLKVGET
jgi:excisionase family DNA binding protein